MTSATSGANAPAMPVDRRAALGFVARVGALMLPTAGLAATALAAPDDPIFTAIDCHRVAYARFAASINPADGVRAKQEGRTVTEAEEAERDAADEDEAEALLALLATPPLTKAGARALIEYVSNPHFDIGNTDDALETLFDALLRSPLIAEEA